MGQTTKNELISLVNIWYALKYCTPVMFTWFVCALLSFVRMSFLQNTKPKNPGKSSRNAPRMGRIFSFSFTGVAKRDDYRHPRFWLQKKNALIQFTSYISWSTILIVNRISIHQTLDTKWFWQEHKNQNTALYLQATGEITK